MKASKYTIATKKETPADAEVISHQLMIRAGLIRKLAAGIYSWMPMGLRVLQKIENIVRQEMNAAGGQEVLLPAVQPAELWRESGRWHEYDDGLLLKFQDRHKRDFCFGPTHEEVITSLVRDELKSHKQLPVNYYQIQTKFRDETRPRFGVLRSREFTMKDAYSFDLSDEEAINLILDIEVAASYFPAIGVYNELISTGSYELIENSILKRELIDFYETQKERNYTISISLDNLAAQYIREALEGFAIRFSYNLDEGDVYGDRVLYKYDFNKEYYLSDKFYGHLSTLSYPANNYRRLLITAKTSIEDIKTLIQKEISES